MTQKETILQACILAMKIKGIADSIKSEGNDYDMKWHRRYCAQLTDLCNEFLNKATKKK